MWTFAKWHFTGEGRGNIPPLQLLVEQGQQRGFPCPQHFHFTWDLALHEDLFSRRKCFLTMTSEGFNWDLTVPIFSLHVGVWSSVYKVCHILSTPESFSPSFLFMFWTNREKDTFKANAHRKAHNYCPWFHCENFTTAVLKNLPLPLLLLLRERKNPSN